MAIVESIHPPTIPAIPIPAIAAAVAYPPDIVACLERAYDGLFDLADATAAYCRFKHMPADPREHMTAVANLILALEEAERALDKLLDTF